MYSLKLLNRQGSKLYKANATEVAKPRIKLEREGIVEYIALEEREREGYEVGFFVGDTLNFPAKPKPITFGLLGWYSGHDEIAGSTNNIFKDKSGNNNHGVLENFDWNGNGWTGSALKFNNPLNTTFASRNFVRIEGLERRYSAITVQFFVKNLPSGASGSEVGFYNENGNSNDSYGRELTTHLSHQSGFYIDSCRGKGGTYSGYRISTSSTSVFNGENMVTLTMSKGRVIGYRNTTVILSNLGINEAELSFNVAQAFFGLSTFECEFLAVYDRELSVSEIQENIDFFHRYVRT